MIALWAAYGVSQFILTGDWEGLGMLTVGAAGLVCAIIILRDWRRGLYFFFGWLFVEDFARKYLGNNMAIFFAKDILVVFLPFLHASRKKWE